MSKTAPDWRNYGVRITRRDQLDFHARTWPGMALAEAVSYATAGANKIWAGTATIRPDAKTGPHHHGELESIICVVAGTARMRWGDRLEYTAVAGPGDFIYVPPYVPHQEMNGSRDEPLECLVIRNDREPVVVKLAIEEAEEPETVDWIDPGHPSAFRAWKKGYG